MSDSYSALLGRDYRAGARLNYQHWLVREQTGFLLSPRIPQVETAADTGLTIADVGSGTCVWLVELARRLSPNTTLHAFDVSDALFPPKAWLPSNVTTHTHDAFEPFPADLRGKFDIVHVQFFITIVKGGRPQELIRNIATLLKPGGYLQWVEGNPSSSSIARVLPETSAVGTERMLRFLKKPRALSSVDWIASLDECFVDAGLSHVTRDAFPIKDDHFAYWNMNHLMLYDEYIGRILAGPDLTDQQREEALEHLEAVPRVAAELAAGVSIRADMLCIVGRGP